MLMWWRRLRIGVLLLILIGVALGTWLDRVYTTSWKAPLGIGVYPTAADSTDAAAQFVERLERDDYADIEEFFAREAQRYDVALDEPLRLWLGDKPQTGPPALGPDPGVLDAIVYSLRLRWHAWRTLADQPGPTPHVRMYVLYHDPALTPQLPHSLGLDRGLIGVVHLFADAAMAGSNDVVLAHEILHTLGASDKYRVEDGQPTYPHGYADPERSPLHPQLRAELMGGRIPMTSDDARIPVSLHEVVVGPATAVEIGWRHEGT